MDNNNFVDAVKYAKKNLMWGHAFLLSQQISKADYLNTINDFTLSLTGSDESTLKDLYLKTSKTFCESKTVFTTWASGIIEILEDQSTSINFEKIMFSCEN